MKLNKFISILAVVILLLPASCSRDFLDQADSTSVSEQALFKKPDDALALVSAIYNTYHDYPDLWFKFGPSYISNYPTLDFLNWGGDIFWSEYAWEPDNGNITQYWQQHYKGIAAANSALPILARMKDQNLLSPQLADRLSGEVHFLRGFFYYYLASVFGGVPLELDIITDGLKPRSTQDEVFAQVEEDMATAVSLLPWKEELGANDVGRATKGAALGYLGAAQLWLKKYTDAVSTYDQLTGKYQLEEDYINVHEYNNRNGKESLFEIQFSIPPGGNASWGKSNDATWLQSFEMPEEITGMGYEYANALLYSSFQPGDTRKLATVIGPGDEHPSPMINIKDYAVVQTGFANGDPRYIGTNGEIINTAGTLARPWKGADAAMPRSGYFGTKTWRNPAVDGGGVVFSDQNVIMLRLGEVLISKADAQYKGGDAAGALATIQQVRNRAWGKLSNPAIVVPPPVETDVMKIILDEYRHELAGETSLWFCLKRTGQVAEYISDKFGVIIPPGRDLMPIPTLELGKNPNLVQNPNY